MIRVTIKASFIGDRPLRVFTFRCEEQIKKLSEQGIAIYMERSTLLRLDSSGYIEVEKGTVAEVRSEEKLSETQIYDLERQIRALFADSFYSKEDWGEITFIFSVVTVITF